MKTIVGAIIFVSLKRKIFFRKCKRMIFYFAFGVTKAAFLFRFTVGNHNDAA